MNCRDAARRLPGYMDGAIPSKDHAIIREHLDACGECRDLLESYRRLSVCLAKVEQVAPPADLAMRIRVQAAHSVSPWVSVRRTWSRAFLGFQDIFGRLAVPSDRRNSYRSGGLCPDCAERFDRRSRWAWLQMICL